MNLKRTVFACSITLLISCSGGGSDSTSGTASTAVDPGASTAIKYDDIADIANPTGDPGSTAAACGDATSPGLPSGFVRCGSEYETCTLPQASDVAYGTPGSYSIKYNLSGSVMLGNSIFGDPAYGEAKSGYYRPTNVAASKSALLSSLAWIKAHVTGKTVLTPAQLNQQRLTLDVERGYLGSDPSMLKAAGQIVTAYETNVGVFFVSAKTPQRFANCSIATDGLEASRAVYSIQQGLHDAVTTDLIEKYTVLFDRQAYKTAAFFPGAVEPPLDAATVHDVQINATMAADWGNRTLASQLAIRRPTGYYLAPGSIVTITVPDALVNQGFEIMVGAHALSKYGRERFDRVSKSYPINNKTMRIANAFGGGIYIIVPYKAAAGNVTVGIANAVRSPLFSNTSLRKTTAAEWAIERLHPGPWADFETDKFMLNVPRSMIYAQGDMTTAMAKWDKAMDGVSEVLGYTQGVGGSPVRNNVVLYLQVDTSIAAGVYAPGYPQVNIDYDPKSVQNGNSTAWWLRDPSVRDSDTELHELGHAQFIPGFSSETESSLHMLKSYVDNVKFGVGLDAAFSDSTDTEGVGSFTRDQVAIGWMVRQNYRDGKPMDTTDSDYNEIRYQHRGHAKYVEIAGLLGWKPIALTHYKSNLATQNGTVATDTLSDDDRRILSLSKSAGVDLTPLIHFWGTQPANATALAAAITAAGLPKSQRIYDRLVHYQGLIPLTNADFQTHMRTIYTNFDGLDAGNKLYQHGWYKANYASYSAAMGNAAVLATQNILKLYFPAGRPATNTSAAPQ